MKFYMNTDNVDIAAKSIGVHGPSLPDRGLCIQIRHNGDKELFEKACKMAAFIVQALNEAEKVQCGTCHGTNPFNCGPDCV